MSQNDTCNDCKLRAPKTVTIYTLVGAKHGWRLTREKKRGVDVMTLRCPSCWKAYKARREHLAERTR